MKTTETTRPLAERITPGLVTHETVNHWGQEQTIILADGRETARILGGVNGNMLPESLADAELIAEAINTTHETGRTPRQLADERAELIALLREAIGYIKAGFPELEDTDETITTSADDGPEATFRYGAAIDILNRITQITR